jgi:hypothetical protein
MTVLLFYIVKIFGFFGFFEKYIFYKLITINSLNRQIIEMGIRKN